MGNPIPPQPPDAGFGDDCLRCHAAGKTPNYVFIRFWDIVPCGANPPPPNGMTFICAQDPGTPCYYRGDLNFGGINYQCHYNMATWQAGIWYAELQLNSPDTPQPLYFWQLTDMCAVDFSINNNTCPPNAGTGGHAHVQVFVPPIIILLTTHYHFVTTDHPLYEIQEVGMDHKLVHLADRNGKTNCLFYIDTQELEPV